MSSRNLTDEFAQLIGPDFETIDALKNSIRTSLSEQATAQADNEYLEQVLSTLVEQSTLNYPNVVIEDQIDSMLNDIQMQLRGLVSRIWMFTIVRPAKAQEEMRKNLREDAVKQAERNLVISEILRTEALEISDEEMEERIALLTQGDDVENSAQMATFLRNESGRAVLESQLLRTKAMNVSLPLPAVKPRRWMLLPPKMRQQRGCFGHNRRCRWYWCRC